VSTLISWVLALLDKDTTTESEDKHYDRLARQRRDARAVTDGSRAHPDLY